MNKNAFDRSNVSRALDTYRTIVPNPLVQAALIGGAGYGLSSIMWGRLVETARSLGRPTLRRLSGLSNEEFDEAMDELREHKTYRHIIPAAFGIALGGASLMPAWNTNEKWNGVMSWTPGPKGTTANMKNTYLSPGLPAKTAMLKKASDFFMNSSWVPELEYDKRIDARDTLSMFSNDPLIRGNKYAYNSAVAAVADSCNVDGSMKPTLGTIQDVTASHISNALSWKGVANVAARSMISNTAARLFTNALDATIGLDPDTKRNIVDAGTWAGAITSIFS